VVVALVATGCGATIGTETNSQEEAPADVARPRAFRAPGALPDGGMKTMSIVCGDGQRNEVTEECDRGARATATTACTRTCRLRDVRVAGPDGARRALGHGRHPIAATASELAVVHLEQRDRDRVLVVRRFDADGVAVAPAAVVAVGVSVDSDPSIAALGDGSFVVVWSSSGAAQERDVLLRRLTPDGSLGPVVRAHASPGGDQFAPDVLSNSDGLVVAWADTRNAESAPDVFIRTFDGVLTPTSAELALAGGLDGDVALANFGGSWSAAWRTHLNGAGYIRIKAGSASWEVGPLGSAIQGGRPSLAELDATHLVLAFADTDGIHLVTLSTASPGNVPVGSPVATGRDANLVRVASRIYLAWGSDSPADDSAGEELWLKTLGWSGGVLDMSAETVSLPRWPDHRDGDQRHPSLAAMGSSTVAVAWEDLGHGFGPTTNGEVAFQIVPVPVVRRAGGSSTDPSCAEGQMLCDEQCRAVEADAMNCGQCGRACPGVPNGSPSCSASACGFTCGVGYIACNDACVSRNDVSHCGSCSNVCAAPPAGTPTCSKGTCDFACSQGLLKCSGGCVASDIANCGACNRTCPAPTNGAATCAAGSCGVACNDGYIPCGSACIRPASAAGFL
jgi:hypothetical protein